MSIFLAPLKPASTDTFAGGAATFGEIAAAAYDQMLYVDNTTAAQAAMEEAYDRRNDDVFAATGVKLTNPVRFGGWQNDDGRTPAQRIADWERQLGEAAGRLPDQSAAAPLMRSVESDALEIARRSDAKLARLMESRPGFGKYAAALAGGAGASVFDPVALGSILLGGGPGAVRTVAGRLIATATKEALINGATEAAMQPIVQDWRRRAGLPHGLDEAVSNIAFAAGLGGLLGGAGQIIGEGAGRLAGRSLEDATAAAQASPAVPAPIKQALRGEVTPASRAALEEIRPALPPAARGALDAADTIDHLDATRPASLGMEAHDLNVTAAHRAVDAADIPRFRLDAEQIGRVAREIAGPSAEPGSKPPLSLVEFLAARGGVVDHKGELAAIGAQDLARNRARRGKPDKRVALDAAREAAEEAGYIGRAGEVQTTTTADLLDAIDAELRGQPVYARADEDQVRAGRQADSQIARLEGTVAAVARHAGPGVDDAILRQAAELAERDGIDPFDALESVYVRAESNEAVKAQRGDPMPGWSDEELDAISFARGDEPFADPKSPFDDPSAADEFAITPQEVEEFGEIDMPGDDGRVVSLKDYMDQIAQDDELATIVKACRT